MIPRDRVLGALHHQPTDRVPRFGIWIDALLDELGGLTLPSEMQQTNRVWRECYASTYWPDFLDTAGSGVVDDGQG